MTEDVPANASWWSQAVRRSKTEPCYTKGGVVQVHGCLWKGQAFCARAAPLFPSVGTEARGGCPSAASLPPSRLPSAWEP